MIGKAHRAYLSIFIDESFETLDELTEALLALEAGGGREKNIEQLFIAAHRIKGSAASIGLNRVAKLAHYMEDLLQSLVDDKGTLTSEMADGMLACTDGLRQYVDALKSGRPGADSFGELAQKLPKGRPSDTKLQQPLPSPEVCQNKEATATPAAAETLPSGAEPAGLTDELHQRVAAAVPGAERHEALVGQVVFEPNLPLVGLKARLVFEKLSNVGNVRYLDPPAAELEDREEIATIVFGIVTDKPVDTVRRALQIAGVHEVAIEPLEVHQSPSPSSSASPSASPSRTATADPGVKPGETLRVDIERLDRLMNLAGQLAIGKARMAQITRTS